MQWEESDGVTTLALAGRLDTETAEPTETEILERIEQGTHRLVLDLSDVTFVSSMGLRMLMAVAKKIHGVQGALAVCGLEGPVREVFQIAGFEQVFRSFADREAAISAVRE